MKFTRRVRSGIFSRYFHIPNFDREEGKASLSDPAMTPDKFWSSGPLNHAALAE
jgi:hypothetical protein